MKGPLGAGRTRSSAPKAPDLDAGLLLDHVDRSLRSSRNACGPSVSTGRCHRMRPALAAGADHPGQLWVALGDPAEHEERRPDVELLQRLGDPARILDHHGRQARPGIRVVPATDSHQVEQSSTSNDEAVGHFQRRAHLDRAAPVQQEAPCQTYLAKRGVNGSTGWRSVIAPIAIPTRRFSSSAGG